VKDMTSSEKIMRYIMTYVTFHFISFEKISIVSPSGVEFNTWLGTEDGRGRQKGREISLSEISMVLPR
jgi:hypothetical protein